VVAAGLADRCTMQVSYAIGVAKPLSIYVDTHGTGKGPRGELEKAVAEVMDLTPRGIRTHLDLNRPIYARTAPTAISAARPRRRWRLLVGAKCRSTTARAGVLRGTMVRSRRGFPPKSQSACEARNSMQRGRTSSASGSGRTMCSARCALPCGEGLRRGSW
jgi:hypothetical protein